MNNSSGGFAWAAACDGKTLNKKTNMNAITNRWLRNTLRIVKPRRSKNSRGIQI